MALFQDSTQAIHWVLTPTSLQKRRLAALPTKQPPPLTPSSDGSEDDTVAPLTLQEEALLRQHHERRILRYGRKHHLPTKVTLTAVSYFKRFYVDRSVTAYNPSVVALSALYASGKVEEVYIPVAVLVEDYDNTINDVRPNVSLEAEPDSKDNTAVRVSADALLKVELAFLQQLEFHLIVFHPFRSLGVIREYLHKARVWADEDETKGESQTLNKVAQYAENLVSTVVPLTDATLTHVPAQVALAAAVIAAVDLKAEPNEDSAADAILSALDHTGADCRMSVFAIVSLIRAAVDSGENDLTEIQQLEERRKRLAIRRNDPMCEEYVNTVVDMEEEDTLVGKKRASAYDEGIGDSDEEDLLHDTKRWRSLE